MNRKDTGLSDPIQQTIYLQGYKAGQLAERERCAEVARGFDGSGIKGTPFDSLSKDIMEIMSRHIVTAIKVHREDSDE